MWFAVLTLFGITCLPAFELRASIPFGILSGTVPLPFGWHVQGMGLPWAQVLFICVLSNMVLGLIIFPLITHGLNLLDKIPWIGTLHQRWIRRVQTKMQQSVNRWGTLGVAFFIAIPLPGSGSYSGAVGATLLGMPYRSYLLANCLGVTLAGVLVTIMTVSGQSLWTMWA